MLSHRLHCFHDDRQSGLVITTQDSLPVSANDVVLHQRLHAFAGHYRVHVGAEQDGLGSSGRPFEGCDEIPGAVPSWHARGTLNAVAGIVLHHLCAHRLEVSGKLVGNLSLVIRLAIDAHHIQE